MKIIMNDAVIFEGDESEGRSVLAANVGSIFVDIVHKSADLCVLRKELPRPDFFCEG